MKDKLSIEIDQNELPILIEYYNDRVNKAKSALISLEATLKSLKMGLNIGTYIVSNSPVNSVNNTANTSLIHADGYNNNWTWMQKIKHILNGNRNTTSEIVAKVLDYEPEKKDERGKIVSTVSALLSAHSKEDGIFEKSKNERNENIFFLTDEYKKESSLTAALNKGTERLFME